MSIGLLTKRLEDSSKALARAQYSRLLAVAKSAATSQSPKPTRLVAGCLGTVLKLLGQEVPIALLSVAPGLGQEIEEEASDVVQGRPAVPRFVASWDMGRPEVAWSAWEPEGVFAEEEELRRLFRATVYLRHLHPLFTPDVFRWLRDACRDEGALRDKMVALREVHDAQVLLLGDAVEPFFDPAEGRGALVPRWMPHEEEGMVALFRGAMAGPPGEKGLGSVLEVGAVRAGSVGARTLFLRSLQAVLGNQAMPAARRMCVAGYGYIGLRERDALATLRGPTTGARRIWEPLVWVEPHMEVLRHADGMYGALEQAHAAIQDREGVDACGRARRFLAVLLRAGEAQERDGIASRADMEHIRKVWDGLSADVGRQSKGVWIGDRRAPDDGRKAAWIRCRREGFVPASIHLELAGRRVEVWTAVARWGFEFEGKWSLWEGQLR